MIPRIRRRPDVPPSVAQELVALLQLIEMSNSEDSAEPRELHPHRRLLDAARNVQFELRNGFEVGVQCAQPMLGEPSFIRAGKLDEKAANPDAALVPRTERGRFEEACDVWVRYRVLADERNGSSRLND